MHVSHTHGFECMFSLLMSPCIFELLAGAAAGGVAYIWLVVKLMEWYDTWRTCRDEMAAMSKDTVSIRDEVTP